MMTLDEPLIVTLDPPKATPPPFVLVPVLVLLVVGGVVTAFLPASRFCSC